MLTAGRDPSLARGGNMMMAARRSLRRPLDLKLERLAAVPGLRRCSRASLRTLAHLGEWVEVPPDTILLTEGTRPKWSSLVIEGQAVASHDGRPTGMIGPGDWIADLALIRGQEASYRVAALTAMTILTVSRGSLLTGIVGNSGLRETLVRALAARTTNFET